MRGRARLKAMRVLIPSNPLAKPHFTTERDSEVEALGKTLGDLTQGPRPPLSLRFRVVDESRTDSSAHLNS